MAFAKDGKVPMDKSGATRVLRRFVLLGAAFISCSSCSCSAEFRSFFALKLALPNLLQFCRKLVGTLSELFCTIPRVAASAVICKINGRPLAGMGKNNEY